MNVIDLATSYLMTNAANVWVITVLAYGQLWAVRIDMTPAAMLLLTVADKVTTSKGGGIKLRGMCKDGRRNTPKMFNLACTVGTPERICSRDEFLATCAWAKKTHKRNIGETAEQLLRDFYGLPMYWYKDSTPGTVAGDMVVNGIHIQHKHQNGTFAQ